MQAGWSIQTVWTTNHLGWNALPPDLVHRKEKQSLDRPTCTPGSVLPVLSCLLGRRLLAATSSCHERLGNRPVFSHPVPGVRRQWLVVRFFLCPAQLLFVLETLVTTLQTSGVFVSAGVVIQDSFAVLSCFHSRECVSSLHCRSTAADHYYRVTTVGLLSDQAHQIYVGQ